MKIIATNKKANYEYYIISTFEAGIVLTGCEVKSIRLGHTNLQDSFITFDKRNECFIKNMHISPYEKGNIFNKDPMRDKKLLMHKREIMTLFGKVKQDGLTLIPLSLYFKKSRVTLQSSSALFSMH